VDKVVGVVVREVRVDAEREVGMKRVEPVLRVELPVPRVERVGVALVVPP